DGRFVFDTLSEGDYTVDATADGFTTARKPGVPTGTEDLDLSLTPEAVFAGQALTEDGAPVEKAQVFLTTPSPNRQSFRATSDAKGSFQVKKLPAGTFGVTADHPDYTTWLGSPVTLQEGERVKDQVIRLARGVSVKGKVVDAATGSPIAGAAVSLRLRPEGADPNQGAPPS